MGLNLIADIHDTTIEVKAAAAEELAAMEWPIDNTKDFPSAWIRCWTALHAKTRPTAKDILVCLMIRKIASDDMHAKSMTLVGGLTECGFSIEECLRQADKADETVSQTHHAPASSDKRKAAVQEHNTSKRQKILEDTETELREDIRKAQASIATLREEIENIKVVHTKKEDALSDKFDKLVHKVGIILARNETTSAQNLQDFRDMVTSMGWVEVDTKKRKNTSGTRP
jgi:DNA-binding transcriptional MerR regulator